MGPDSGDDLLVAAHERKLLAAVGTLEEARHQVLRAAACARAEAACARDSSIALRRERAQARRRRSELLGDAEDLTERTERLIAEAMALQGERQLVAAD